MQLVGADLVEPELVRRATEMPAEVGDGVDVRLLRRWRQIADRHVLDHAAAQRADGLLGGLLGHHDLLRLGLKPRSPQDRTPDPFSKLSPRSTRSKPDRPIGRASRDSGFVQRVVTIDWKQWSPSIGIQRVELGRA